MAIALGILVVVAFGYFVYREMSKPNKKGSGTGGVKPNDSAPPNKD